MGDGNVRHYRYHYYIGKIRKDSDVFCVYVIIYGLLIQLHSMIWWHLSDAAAPVGIEGCNDGEYYILI